MMYKLLLEITISLVFLEAYLCQGFKLTLLHTNDVHARFEQTDKYGGQCSPQDVTANKCFGGVARRHSKVQEIKNSKENVLFLDAGDQFQGTLWFVEYKGNATKHFMQELGYDVMVLGNHEFDNGVEGLAPFLTDPGFPVISSNIDTSREPLIDGKVTKSVVLDVDGEKIGIVGYTYKDTPSISSPGDTLTFTDEITAVREEVERLQNQEKINKIIGLGHSGFDIDKKVAAQVEGLDVVIGGHTNTFLYTGDPPSNDVPVGEYPFVVTQNKGKKVLCVQDFAYGKYLGFLEVNFDDDGELVDWSGNPILLDGTIQQDPVMLAEVKEWAKPLEAIANEVVGSSNVVLDGARLVCRIRECNMGNLAADAILMMELKDPTEDAWSVSPIAVLNSGGIRASLAQGDFTMGQVLEVYPFPNTIDRIELKGRHLLDALEHAVYNYDPEAAPGAFLQVSGLIITYDLSADPGQRVVDVQVRCNKCDVPKFEPLDEDAVYSIRIPDFLVDGGDGFTVIAENFINRTKIGFLISDAVVEYTKSRSPIIHGLENRIIFSDKKKPDCENSTPGLISDGINRVTILTVLLAVIMFS